MQFRVPTVRPPPILTTEDDRVAALNEYNLIGSAPEPAFTQIVGLAARLFQVPTAFVSLLGRNQQVFHAKVGLNLCETDREITFCSHTIAQNDPLIVLDAALDPRFHDNPLVIGPPFIRFYAGVPLHAPSGHAVGTLCLADLREAQVGIAFDDYGTGYASLSLLKRFPLTRLKIDRSFVTGMLASHQDVTIVRAILQLGHGFKLAVIAEGIETEAEHACLRAMGCQEGQGYLFGKPMPAEAFANRFGLGIHHEPRTTSVAA